MSQNLESASTFLVLVAPCKGIRIPESGKILLMESEILGFGIQNTAQGIRNPTNDWKPESKFHWLESST